MSDMERSIAGGDFEKWAPVAALAQKPWEQLEAMRKQLEADWEQIAEDIAAGRPVVIPVHTTEQEDVPGT